MGVPKRENKIKKWEKRIKAAESNNPELAKKMKGKLAAIKGKKD
ncbi:MAG TPA: hypothetical protein PK122_01490 [Candidatus Paceibacterota bacterium]|nr:hypothetical protein [Candidatus Paceibacterota bacterium]